MKFGIIITGAGLALALSALPISAFAQAPAGTTASSATVPGQAETNNPNGAMDNGGTTSSTTTSSASTSSTTASSAEMTPQAKADQVKNEMDSAQNQGKDVSKAHHEYNLGMRDMDKGENNQALQHFAQAENDLGGQRWNTQSSTSSTSTGTMGNPPDNSNNSSGANIND